MCLMQPNGKRINALNAAARKLYGLAQHETGGLRMADLQASNPLTEPGAEGIVLQAGARLEHHQTKGGETLIVEVMSENITINQNPAPGRLPYSVDHQHQ